MNKTCPILNYAGTGGKCIGSDCQWWVEAKKECAVKVVAEAAK